MLIFFVVVISWIIPHVFTTSPCIKLPDSLPAPLVLISPCEVTYPQRDPRDAETGRRVSPASTPATAGNRGFPAVFAGTNLFVSVDAFHERHHCLNVSMLPKVLHGESLTGAGFSSHFLHLLFGQHILRVPFVHLQRWLHLHPVDLDVVKLTTNATRISAAPCCADTLWCSRASRRVVAYALEPTDGDKVVLQVSEDEGATYKKVPVKVPPGSEPLTFAEYPSEEYGALFFNNGGKGHVIHVPYECQEGLSHCEGDSKKLVDKSLASVVLGRSLGVQTVLVTQDGHLEVSSLADTSFEPAVIVDGDKMEKLKGASLGLPIRGFAADKKRWMIADAHGVVYLGSDQDIWETTVHKLQPSPVVGGDGRSGRGGVFRLVGRTIHEVLVSEGYAGLDVASRAISLSPLLAPLDEKCEIYQLTAVPLSGDEPIVDKSGALKLHVKLNAAARLAARPLVLPSTPLLASELELLSQSPQPDGTVASNWIVTIRSHPEAMRQSYLSHLRLAELRISSTMAQAECPANSPPALPVLVGCNPQLKLRLRNKRVSNTTCEHLQAHELEVPSSPERDPLIRYQQGERGRLNVRLNYDRWRVHWDPAWGCPVMSSDKEKFKPVLVLDDGKSIVPLDRVTAMFDIHGVHDFEFGLTAADAGCRRTDVPESLSWRRTLANILGSSNESKVIDPYAVLNTSSYISCNSSGTLPHGLLPDPALAALKPSDINLEFFGIPGKENTILWGDSGEIHVFSFHIVEPLFTYCDLRLTVPVFYLHATDMTKDTRLVILLAGVGLGLLVTLAAHFSNQATIRLKEEKRQHLELLLNAAQLFATEGEEPRSRSAGSRVEL